MKFFCPIALRDWFINLCDCFPSSRRAGPRSSLALRHVRFSAHKKICDEPGEMFAGSYGTSNEPRPTCLAGSVCLFVCLFVFSSQPHTYFIVGEETPVQKCWYWRPTRKLLPINQSEEGLNSNHDLIIRVFKSLIVAITFSSHKACKVHTL